MKPFGSNKVLGLAVGDQGILAAEVVRAAGGRAQSRRLAEFPYPPGRSLDDPAPLGEAFAEFLKQNGLSARHAVIGLPLKWVVVRPKEVPPAAPEVVNDLLRLQAEGEFSDAANLVVEYAGESTPTGSRTVLLTAVQRKRLDNLVAMAEAAGLKVQAVMLSAVALGAQTSKHLGGGDGLVLHVAPGAAELAVHHGGQPRLLRHLRPVAAAVGATAGAGGAVPFATPANGSTNGANGFHGAPGSNGSGPAGASVPGLPAPGLVGELRQVLSLMPQNGRGTGEELVVWDGVGLGDDAPRTWGDALGISIKPERLTSLGVAASGPGGEPEDAQAGRYAPAVALALAGLAGPAALAPDFLHSRLAPPRQARVQRKAVWAAVLGVLLVGLIGYAWWDLSAKRQQIEASRARVDAQRNELKSAQATIDRTTFAGAWYRRTPHTLQCVYELTRIFPDDGSAWATTVSLKDDTQGSLIGRATSNTAALKVLERLQNSGKFADVKIVDIRLVGRNSSEVAFSATFTYPQQQLPAKTTGQAAPASASTGTRGGR